MRIIKSISRLLMVGITMLGVCGCMTNNNCNSAESVRDSALEYLCSRYSDTFVAKGYSDRSWAYEYATVTFSCEKFAGELIEVRVYKNDDGSYRFEDNYFRFSMKDEAVSYLEGCLRNSDAEIKVRFPASVWSTDVAGAKTFVAWMNCGTCVMDIYVLSKTELSDNVEIDFVNSIASERIRGSINFCVINILDSVAEMSLDDFLNNQAEYIQSRNKYYINAEFMIEKLN